MADAPAPRVAFLLTAYHPVYGGGLIRIRRFLPHLADRGIASLVIAGPLGGRPHHEVIDDRDVYRVNAHRLPGWLAGPDVFVATARELRRLRGRFDVIHAVGVWWLQMAGVAMGRRLGCPVVVEPTLLGGDDPLAIGRERTAPLFGRLYRRADRVIALSSALEQASRAGGIAPERIVRIPNGVDTGRFRPVDSDAERGELRQSMGLPRSGSLTVMVGELSQRKGIDVLVDAWPSVVRRHPDAHLALVGPVRQTSEGRRFLAQQREKACRLGLAGLVHVPGAVDRVEDALRAADVFALASESEGLPNVVLEAMSCGLPTAVTDLPGIASDIIRSSDEGRRVAERSPDGFAEAISNLLDDRDERARIGRAARQRIVDEFSAGRRARLCDELYRELIAERRAATGSRAAQTAQTARPGRG